MEVIKLFKSNVSKDEQLENMWLIFVTLVEINSLKQLIEDNDWHPLNINSILFAEYTCSSNVSIFFKSVQLLNI